MTERRLDGLRRTARDALANYGLELASLRLCLDGYNTTWEVRDAEGERYALRVSRADVDPAAVRGEVAWLDALADARREGVPLPRVIQVVAPEMGGVVEVDGRPCVLTRWLPGWQRSRGLSPRMLAALGRAMAQLHDQAAGWTLPANGERPRLDEVWPGVPDPTPALPAVHAAPLAAAAERLLPLVRGLVEDDARILHADLHQWNYRFARGCDVGVLDFDDASFGHPAQDVAITFYYLATHPRRDALVAAFADGYAAVRPFPLDARLRDALLAWRSLALCASVEAHESEALRAHGRTLLPEWARRAAVWLRGDAPAWLGITPRAA